MFLYLIEWGRFLVLSNEQLNQLKQELTERQDKLIDRIQTYYGMQLEFPHESSGELSSYDNHPADNATELYDRQKNLAIQEHAEDELKAINESLHSIHEGSYGVCSDCGETIAYERLEAVPTAELCNLHVNNEPLYEEKRPIEEEVLSPNLNPHEFGQETDTGFDEEDAWQAVARSGTSDTPSDLYGDHADYDDMYANSDEAIGEVEPIEGLMYSNIEGNYEGVRTSTFDEDINFE